MLELDVPDAERRMEELLNRVERGEIISIRENGKRYLLVSVGALEIDLKGVGSSD